MDPQRMRLCAQDDAVDMKVIRPYTDPDTYKEILREVVRHSQEELVCAICQHPFDTDEVSQKCSSCLLIHHLPCIDRVLKIKNRYWYCKSCTSPYTSKRSKPEEKS